MTLSKPLTIIAGAAAVVALVAAGCGGDDDDSSKSSASNSPATASSSTSQTSSGGSGTVDLANNSSLGQILVDSKGDTLYLFEADSGTTSACSGACASAWPPLRTSGKPTVGSGVDASLIGTTNRSDGQPQVTYNGHPLYTFSGDQAPGDANGEGSTAFGGGWFALSAAGDQVSGSTSTASSGSNSSSTTTTSGGGGFGY